MSKCKLQRLLIITPHFWPETFRINEVAQMVASQGVAITVLTGQPNYPEGRVYGGFRAFGAALDDTPFGVIVARVPVIPRGQGSGFTLLLSYFSFLVSSCVAGAFLLRGRKFDAILFYGVSPILLAATGLWFRSLKKAPLALWVQDLWPGSLSAVGYRLSPLLTRILEFAVGLIYRGSDMILVASKAFAIDIGRIAGRDMRCVYHPNPAEIEVINRTTMTAALAKDDKFEVLFAGNLGRACGLDTILEAAHILRTTPSIKFRLIGAGSRRSWLEQEISRLGLSNITIENRVPPHAMPAILSRASALLVILTRSPAMALSFPSKTSTYMASGTPLIVSADGETARIVEEAGAGLCVAAQDATALVAAIKRLQSMPESERAAMGEAGKAWSRQWFEPSRLASDLIGHLQGAMERYSLNKRGSNAG
ncbi:MAG TPA: glycosyltransferase family 4 protein [Rhizobiaceae bacterium]|nr:glycosyltransferase family 4 protein [Rhizobiaceae bacterium]